MRKELSGADHLRTSFCSSTCEKYHFFGVLRVQKFNEHMGGLSRIVMPRQPLGQNSCYVLIISVWGYPFLVIGSIWRTPPYLKMKGTDEISHKMSPFFHGYKMFRKCQLVIWQPPSNKPSKMVRYLLFKTGH